MSLTAADLARLASADLYGPADRQITGAAALEQAGPEDLSFVADARQLGRLSKCRAGALLAPTAHAEAISAAAPLVAVLAVVDPQQAFQELLPRFRKVRPRPARGISPQAVVSPTATIGADCYVGPGAVIEDEAVVGGNCDIYPGVVIGCGCRLAEDVTLYPRVVLYHDVEIGARSIIHAGAVIGADGFGYRFAGGAFQKIPQLGHVVIEEDVEIGAGTTVDRGAIGATVIGAWTKLDNMVMIGHNCRIGKHNVFASQVGLAGSCSTGDYVRMGGQVGVKDHVHMDTGCSIGAKSGIHKDIPAGETWVGYPATPEAEQKRLVFSLKKVPDLREDFKALQKQVRELQARLEALQPEPETPPMRVAG